MSIQGSKIESTEKLNLLGVTIDSKLNFNHHINMCKKASQRTGVLMRLKNLIPTEAKLQLHTGKAATLPHLTYCHLTWHLYKGSDRRKLEHIEERGLRARINVLVVRNYWQKQTYHRCTTDDYIAICCFLV